MLQPEKLASERIRLNNGLEIPVFALGTFESEGPTVTEIVRKAIEVGYRHIDCAQAYWNQELVAPALKAVPREDLWVTSKLWRGDYTTEKVPEACDRCLRELDTPYLDLWLIHWPDRTVPIGETLEAMYKCQEQGKVKCIGVSNFTIRHIKDALATGVPIAMEQVEHHPYLQQPELFDFCRSKDIALTAYSPLARGKATKDPLLAAIGGKHGKTAAQVAIRWALQQNLVVLAKTIHASRLTENADVFDFQLTPDEMAQINALDEGLRTILPDFNEFDYA
jgi:diketogulonate reductase-like aldo/keto reductase